MTTTAANGAEALSRLNADLGDRPIAEIKASELLDVLRKIERRGRYHTARRARSISGRVFRTGAPRRTPWLNRYRISSHAYAHWLCDAMFASFHVRNLNSTLSFGRICLADVPGRKRFHSIIFETSVPDGSIKATTPVATADATNARAGRPGSAADLRWHPFIDRALQRAPLRRLSAIFRGRF